MQAISGTPLSIPVGFAAFPNELFKVDLRMVAMMMAMIVMMMIMAAMMISIMSMLNTLIEIILLQFLLTYTSYLMPLNQCPIG